MQKYFQSTPDWLYHSPALDDDALPAIQKELIKLSLHTKTNLLVPYSSTFACFGHNDEDKQKIMETCPTLKQEL
jgi:hypothetical protein